MSPKYFSINPDAHRYNAPFAKKTRWADALRILRLRRTCYALALFASVIATLIELYLNIGRSNAVPIAIPVPGHVLNGISTKPYWGYTTSEIYGWPLAAVYVTPSGNRSLPCRYEIHYGSALIDISIFIFTFTSPWAIAFWLRYYFASRALPLNSQNLPICNECGYSLVGLCDRGESILCPECGFKNQGDEVRSN